MWSGNVSPTSFFFFLGDAIVIGDGGLFARSIRKLVLLLKLIEIIR